MWTDEKIATNNDIYVETVSALNNVLANVTGDWVADVTVMADDNQTFYLLAASRCVAPDQIDWKNGLDVMCVMRYDGEDGEKEDAYNVMATFQTAEGEDHVKEMEMIRAILYAWVEEKAFPNARMAVNVQSLLKVKDIQDYLKKTNFPGYIRSSNYRSTT